MICDKWLDRCIGQFLLELWSCEEQHKVQLLAGLFPIKNIWITSRPKNIQKSQAYLLGMGINPLCEDILRNFPTNKFNRFQNFLECELFKLVKAKELMGLIDDEFPTDKVNLIKFLVWINKVKEQSNLPIYVTDYDIERLLDEKAKGSSTNNKVEFFNTYKSLLQRAALTNGVKLEQLNTYISHELLARCLNISTRKNDNYHNMGAPERKGWNYGAIEKWLKEVGFTPYSKGNRTTTKKREIDSIILQLDPIVKSGEFEIVRSEFYKICS